MAKGVKNRAIDGDDEVGETSEESLRGRSSKKSKRFRFRCSEFRELLVSGKAQSTATRGSAPTATAPSCVDSAQPECSEPFSNSNNTRTPWTTAIAVVWSYSVESVYRHYHLYMLAKCAKGIMSTDDTLTSLMHVFPQATNILECVQYVGLIHSMNFNSDRSTASGSLKTLFVRNSRLNVETSIYSSP